MNDIFKACHCLLKSISCSLVRFQAILIFIEVNLFNAVVNGLQISPIRILRGLPFMNSAKLPDFWTPPPVPFSTFQATSVNNLIYFICFSSAPPPPQVGMSFMETPLRLAREKITFSSDVVRKICVERERGWRRDHAHSTQPFLTISES